MEKQKKKDLEKQLKIIKLKLRNWSKYSPSSKDIQKCIWKIIKRKIAKIITKTETLNLKLVGKRRIKVLTQHRFRLQRKLDEIIKVINKKDLLRLSLKQKKRFKRPKILSLRKDISKFNFHDSYEMLVFDFFFFARAHLGHWLYDWNHANNPFGLGLGKEFCHFDINSTFVEYRKMIGFLITFFETKPFAKAVVINGLPLLESTEWALPLSRMLAKLNDLYILRWIPGFFSSRRHVVRHWKQRKFLRKKNEKTKIWHKATYEGLKQITWIPDLVISLSVWGVYGIMVRETLKQRIPVLGIVDTNTSSANVMYPIRGNDDHVNTAQLVLFIVKGAINCGREAAKVNTKKLWDWESLGSFRGGNHKSVKNEKLFGESKGVENPLRKGITAHARAAKVGSSFYFVFDYFWWLKKQKEAAVEATRKAALKKFIDKQFFTRYHFFVNKGWGRYSYYMFMDPRSGVKYDT
jgi:ribosomal protein S2